MHHITSKIEVFMQPCKPQLQFSTRNERTVLKYLKQTVWVNHSIPTTYFLPSDGVNQEYSRNGYQIVVGAHLPPLTGVMKNLY